MQFATGKHGFKQVACVHCAVGFACADNGVQLVDEQNDLSFALLHFVKYGFQTFLEFAAELCACYQRAQVKAVQTAVFKSLRHVACGNTLRQSFGNCRLTDAGFTYQHGVILCLTTKNLYAVTNLVLTSDHGVEFLFLCQFHKVGRVFVKRVERCFGVVACYAHVAACLGKRSHKFVLVCAVACKGFRNGLALFEHSHHHVLDGHVLVLHFVGFGFCRVKHVVGFRRQVNLRVAAHLGQTLYLTGDFVQQSVYVRAAACQHLRDKALLVTQKSVQNVQRSQLDVAVLLRYALRVLYRFQCLLGIFVCVHRITAFLCYFVLNERLLFVRRGQTFWRAVRIVSHCVGYKQPLSGVVVAADKRSQHSVKRQDVFHNLT